MSELKLPFAASDVEAESIRLHHNLGWRFLTCAAANLETSTVALVTINPGGGIYQPPQWSVENGSAYVNETWPGHPPGRARLQIQVQKMFAIMALAPSEVLSGYLVPFRSPAWSTLINKPESLAFGVSLWKEIFARAKLQTVIVFGKDVTGPNVVHLLNAKFVDKVPAAWGDLNIDVYRFGAVNRLMVLPHLSRFTLFGRQKSELAFKHALTMPVE